MTPIQLTLDPSLAWALGICATLATTLAGLWLKGVGDRLSSIDSKLEKHLAATTRQEVLVEEHSRRISLLEVSVLTPSRRSATSK